MTTYRRLCTEFYDLDKPDPPADALAYYLRLANEANGPVLEPMCGSGRFLVTMRRAGVDIDGTDASPDMLDACRRKLEAAGLSAMIELQPCEQLAMPRRYALVLIPAGSFSLLTDPAAAAEALRRLHDHLLPGGRLVFEVERDTKKESHSWPWGGRWLARPDGATLAIS